MRKILILLVATASLAVLPSHADRGYSGQGSRAGPVHGAPGHYGRGGYPGHGYPGHGYRGPGGYHGSGAYHGGGYYPWAGLALFGAVAGLAILAESTRPYYSVPYDAASVVGGPTLFIEQQTGATSPYPAGNWYYCASSTLYYPYTTACPEGWQAVAPTP